ncbi:ionotropic receptor 75a-like [Choristoneura fumiferana]|uniref:ionotropic receptor 75a-like n=1 Tax=Choristoneura fumiferana TaxID=7141 RepID=UPI003D15C212
MGFVSPVIVKAKVIMQKLWLEKIDWDACPPEEITIPDDTAAVQLIGFADASSSTGYGCCIYLRVVELTGTLGRVVIFILFLAFLFLYTAYSASIVVLLQSSSNQIRTLSDLLQSKLELGVEDTPYNRFWFFDPIRKAIYEKKIAPKGSTPRFYSMDEGIKLLQNKPFAFNTNLGVGYRFMEKYFHEHEKCGLQEIAFIQDGSAWSSCYKLSPYKEIFKVGLLRIQEHGLATRVNHLIYVKKPVCAVRGGRFVSVSIVDFYPSLLVLLYGLVLAVVLLGMEILYHRKYGSKDNSNNIIEG